MGAIMTGVQRSGLFRLLVCSSRYGAQVAGQHITRFAPWRLTVIRGGGSVIETLKAQWLLFPLSSVAVQTISVLPIGKNVPDGGLQTTETFASQASVNTGVWKLTVAPQKPAAEGCSMSGRHWHERTSTDT